MSIRNRIIGAVGLSVAVAIAVTGCSGGSAGASSASPAASTSGKVAGTIKVYSNASSQAAITAVANEFEAAHPGVTVDISAAATDVFQQTLATQMTSGTAADVVYVSSGDGTAVSVTTLGKPGYLMDLSNRPWVSKIPQQYRAINEYKGKTLVVPAVVGAIGAIYNTATLDKLGISVPKTFADVEKMCSVAKSQGIAAFALGLQTPSNGQFISYALAASLVPESTNADLASGKTTFPKSKWKQVFTLYKKMDSDGCFQQNPTGTSSEEAYQDVANGKAVASVAVNGALSQIQSYNKDAKLSLFALPATNDPSQLKIAAASSGTWAVNAKTKNPATALAFIDFIASHEADYANAVGSIPMDPSQTPKNLSPALATISSFVKAGKTSSYPDQTWPGPSVQQMHFQVVQEMFTGASVSQALQEMQTAYDSAKSGQ